MVAITRTFTPAAPQRVAPAVRAPVRPTARTTTPARVATPNLSATLAGLRQVGAQQAARRVTFAPPKAKPKSILEQLGDLVIGLPQGLAGFGKDVLTHPLLAPRVLFDLAKDQRLHGGISDYLPASTGMVKSFANTGYDFTHPGEFVDAWQEGRIVSKVVEDVGNAAIFAGGISKALGAGAATGIMSAEEAAAIPTRYGVGATATGRTLEEAAAAGVKVPGGGSLADA